MNKLLHTNILNATIKYITNGIKGLRRQHLHNKLTMSYPKQTLFHPHSSTKTYTSSHAHKTQNLCRRHHNHYNTQQHAGNKSTLWPILHSFHAWTKSNNLILKSDKMTCRLFTPDPPDYNTRLNLHINNTTPDMHTHLDPNHSYNTDNTAAKASKTIPILSFNKIG